MDFSEHRGRVRRRRATCAAALQRARVALLVAPLALAGASGLAIAAPLDEPFVGGMGFNGPTSGNLASVYWNPAALGLARGSQLVIAGTARLTNIHVARTPLNPLDNNAPLPVETASASNLMQPLQWPAGPGGFIGISSDLGGDRFTLAFATYMPFVQQVRYPLSPSGDEATRYHALTIDLRNLALVPALAIRFGNEFRVGVAPGFLFSTGHLLFAEDTALDQGTPGLESNCGGGVACGVENPAAAARYDISSGNGLGEAKFSVTLGGGIYYRRRALELGFAYQSRPLGSDVSGVEVAGAQTTVYLPPRAANAPNVPVACAGAQSNRCVFGDLAYRLPDAFIAGATWHVGPGLEFTGMLRWLWMHVHDRIDVRLLGAPLDGTGLPEHIVLYRGFKDVWDARARVSYWWHERVRVGAMLRFETSAVDARAVNPAAVDAFKIEPVLMAEVQIGRKLWLAAGYGLTIMPEVTVSGSAFNPTVAKDCADSQGNLAGSACLGRLNGQARPSADGHYTSMVQDLGVTLTVKL